ncbi:MAG: alpha/beta hydrolase [Rhodoglobus sp.]|nr:alpha/beta hydrolase [Rhodoglobus sp.]
MRLPTLTALVLLSAVTLAGCTPTGTSSDTVTTTATALHPTLPTDPGVRVMSDIQYGTADGEPLLLDVCLPPDAAASTPEAAPIPAIVAVHGGSWRRGDKADLDFGPACQWLASQGYIVMSVNYRLAPDASFPSALDDVQQAVSWMREPDQVDAWGIDPTRIGIFGASAGGNLAALLGLSGDGGWDRGTRVAAVVNMSGISDLREPIVTTADYRGDFVQAQLDYLGCLDLVDCETAVAASPVTLADPSDPPFLLIHSLDEFIPVGQSEALDDALRTAGVPSTFVRVVGKLHGVSVLDDAMMGRVIDFFHSTLGDPQE